MTSSHPSTLGLYSNFSLCTGIYKDCKDAYENRHRSSGIYTLKPDQQGSTFQAYCDMHTDGGGWTVFQRRKDGSVNFYRNWNDYVVGFGSPNGEHWLGLEKIYRLTKASRNTLRVELGDYSGNRAYAKYNYFKLGNAATRYTLRVSGYSGTARDSLSYHNGMKFSTKDRDNDANGGNCAVSYKGAWWYRNCHYSNLNGLYSRTRRSGAQYNSWYHWKNRHESLKFTEMKVRRQ